MAKPQSPRIRPTRRGASPRLVATALVGGTLLGLLLAAPWSVKPAIGAVRVDRRQLAADAPSSVVALKTRVVLRDASGEAGLAGAIAPPRAFTASEERACENVSAEMNPHKGVQQLAQDPAVDAAVDASQHDILKALHDSGDAYERAVADWVEASPGDPQMGQLVREAVNSSDPRVYVLALQACGDAQDGGCSMLSPRRWADLEPGNGAPWALELAQAEEEHDDERARDALFQMSVRTQLNFHNLEPAQVLLGAAREDGYAVAAEDGLVSVALDRMSPVWVLSFLVNDCAFSARQDANSMQVCMQVASNVWTAGAHVRNSRVDAGIIADNLGIRHDWLGAAVQERDAVLIDAYKRDGTHTCAMLGKELELAVAG